MSTLPELEWIRIARGYLGTSEIAGAKHNPVILSWWQKIGQAIRDDETPYCAAFVGACLEQAGKGSTRSAAARSYLKYGVDLRHSNGQPKPCYGAVAVFWRGKPSGWSGHVGFIVGRDARGYLMVLGSNQGNTTSIRPFLPGRLLGVRWPGIAPNPERFNLPILDSDGALSSNEA